MQPLHTCQKKIIISQFLLVQRFSVSQYKSLIYIVFQCKQRVDKNFCYQRQETSNNNNFSRSVTLVNVQFKYLQITDDNSQRLLIEYICPRSIPFCIFTFEGVPVLTYSSSVNNERFSRKYATDLKRDKKNINEKENGDAETLFIILLPYIYQLNDFYFLIGPRFYGLVNFFYDYITLLFEYLL